MCGVVVTVVLVCVGGGVGEVSVLQYYGTCVVV